MKILARNSKTRNLAIAREWYLNDKGRTLSAMTFVVLGNGIFGRVFCIRETDMKLVMLSAVTS